MTSTKLALATILSLAFTPLAAQDYDKGLAAFSAGDYSAALQEWTPLAEQGNAMAQYGLGHMNSEGIGIPQNYVEALKWLRMSAEQGNDRAQLSLAIMFKAGTGIPQDYAEAVKWHRLSAKDQLASQLGLAAAYQFGNGVLQNNVMAHMWYNIASANGVKSADHFRDMVEADMTPDDISKAQAMARECMNSGYSKCSY